MIVSATANRPKLIRAGTLAARSSYQVWGDGLWMLRMVPGATPRSSEEYRSVIREETRVQILKLLRSKKTRGNLTMDQLIQATGLPRTVLEDLCPETKRTDIISPSRVTKHTRIVKEHSHKSTVKPPSNPRQETLPRPKKPVRPKSSPNYASDPRMQAPKSGVTVRMYRTGLGDCFLLCFPRKPESKTKSAMKPRPAFVLIDCGVFKGTSGGPARIKMIAEHIRRATNEDAEGQGRSRLELLVVTHEHWDHLSGFHESQARGIFEQFDVGAVWLPWTENDADPLARQLRGLKAGAAKAPEDGLQGDGQPGRRSRRARPAGEVGAQHAGFRRRRGCAAARGARRLRPCRRRGRGPHVDQGSLPEGPPLPRARARPEARRHAARPRRGPFLCTRTPQGRRPHPSAQPAREG